MLSGSPGSTFTAVGDADRSARSRARRAGAAVAVALLRAGRAVADLEVGHALERAHHVRPAATPSRLISRPGP